jgi:hypothetical protein
MAKHYHHQHWVASGLKYEYYASAVRDTDGGCGIRDVAIMAIAFLVKWPPGPIVFVVEDDGGGERKALDGASQCDARETGVEAMGVDVCDRESCEAERGGPLPTLRRRRR